MAHAALPAQQSSMRQFEPLGTSKHMDCMCPCNSMSIYISANVALIPWDSTDLWGKRGFMADQVCTASWA